MGKSGQNMAEGFTTLGEKYKQLQVVLFGKGFVVGQLRTCSSCHPCFRARFGPSWCRSELCGVVPKLLLKYPAVNVASSETLAARGTRPFHSHFQSLLRSGSALALMKASNLCFEQSMSLALQYMHSTFY
eukprot:4022977-Amphidinium_carterae.1